MRRPRGSNGSATGSRLTGNGRGAGTISSRKGPASGGPTGSSTRGPAIRGPIEPVIIGAGSTTGSVPIRLQNASSSRLRLTPGAGSVGRMRKSPPSVAPSWAKAAAADARKPVKSAALSIVRIWAEMVNDLLPDDAPGMSRDAAAW